MHWSQIWLIASASKRDMRGLIDKSGRRVHEPHSRTRPCDSGRAPAAAHLATPALCPMDGHFQPGTYLSTFHPVNKQFISFNKSKIIYFLIFPLHFISVKGIKTVLNHQHMTMTNDIYNFLSTNNTKNIKSLQAINNYQQKKKKTIKS